MFEVQASDNKVGKEFGDDIMNATKGFTDKFIKKPAKIIIDKVRS